MKNNHFLIFFLLLILFFGACQKANDVKLKPKETVSGIAPTPLNFFNEKLDFKNLVSQNDSKGNATRYLIKFDSPVEKNGLYKYLLVETSLANRHSVKTFIISDTRWAGTVNLFRIKMVDNSVIYKFAGAGSNKKIAGKPQKKDTTNENTASRPPTDSYNNCQQIDWYLVTIDNNTGEVLGERYVGSSFDCENGSGGSGGSGTGEADSEVNLMTDPCKNAALAAITSTANMNTLVSRFYNNSIIPSSSPINVVFSEGNGFLSPARTTNLNGNSWSIQLNNGTGYSSSSMSQEAWGAIIAHEILHLYFLSNPNIPYLLQTEPIHHNQIFYNLINTTSDLLQQSFGMSHSNATKLALNGLADLWQWSDFDVISKSLYGYTFSQIQNTYTNYTIGNAGTRCN